MDITTQLTSPSVPPDEAAECRLRTTRVLCDDMNRVIHEQGWARPPTGDATKSVTAPVRNPCLPCERGWVGGRHVGGSAWSTQQIPPRVCKYVCMRQAQMGLPC